MELKVISVKRTDLDSEEKKNTKFTSKLKNLENDVVLTITEEDECSFTKGDVWELKRQQTQTKLPSKKKG